MELIDQDGDRLEFLIDAKGNLCEYLNGKLELGKVQRFRYSVAEGTVHDDTGVFQIKKEEQVEKALGLRALASRAGVVWQGDEPVPATAVVLTDTDGDMLEFILTESGKLMEKSNGQVDIEEVHTLKFNFSTGTVVDDTGHFTLPANECIQKAAALRSLAAQAGVMWSGDEPDLVLDARATLDIENCASDWEFQCPKKWDKLLLTDKSNQRFCETCKETVYFCSTREQLQEHTLQRHCVAFELHDTPSHMSSVTEAADASDASNIRVALMSGQELPPVSLPPSRTIKQLKACLASTSKIPIHEQRLLLEERELLDGDLLSTAGVTSNVTLHLVRVKPREAKLEPPKVRRMMGKRAAPRRG